VVVLAVVAVAAVVLGIQALGGDGGSRKRAPTQVQLPPSERPEPGRSFLEQVVPGQSGGGLPGAGAPARIAAAVKAMPVEEKVAQAMLLGFEGQGPRAPVLALLRKRPLGGVVLRRANFASATQVSNLAARATLAARSARHDPPFVVAAQEGGDFNALPGLPPESAPADLQSVRGGALEASAATRALARANVNGVLGPVVDVGTGGGDALGGRAFSDRPAQSAHYGAAVIAAYRRAGMLAAAEHFPGEGAATQPTEDGPASVGLTLGQLRKRDLVPFRTAIRAGVPAVVISNASYVTDDFVVPGTQSSAVADELLRGELGFRGVAIADDLAAPAVTNSMSVADAAVGALKAGADLVYISGTARGQEAAYQALLQAARSGTIPRERLDEAVTRVLTLKRELGLVRGVRPRTRIRPLAPQPVPGVVGPPPAAGTPAAPVTPPPAQPSTQPGAP
jgi:beta-N-acetylhexosaminidase